MSRRALAGLLGALAVLAIIVGITLLAGRDGGREDKPLLPELKNQLNDIRRVVITGPGNHTIATLERGDEAWTVAERNNYAADVSRLRKNLLALAEARVVEEKTSNPEFYERLGVQDMADEGAGGVQLTLASDRELASVIIGKTPSGSTDFVYARRAAEPTSWLITGQFDLGKTGGEWLNRSLTDIAAERIQSVTISHPGQGTLRLSRPAKPPAESTSAAATAGPAADTTPELQVEGIPAGRELSYPGVTSGIAVALTDLRMEDVQTRDALGAVPGKPVVARFVTTDGLTVEASTWTVADGTRVTFLASGEGDAGKEAAALNARLGGWVYTLPSYKTEQLTRKLEDLLAPK
jgi:hypothetical protein